MTNNRITKIALHDIHYLSDPAPFAEKTRHYLAVRQREGRVLSDDQVLKLPQTDSLSRAQRREWRWRARSLGRLLRYLSRRPAGLCILDLGCGNGWMSMQLSGLPDSDIWAVDVNLPELEQGARVAQAAGKTNITFAFADILKNTLPEAHFDVVLLAAAVQYFPELPALLAAARRVLKPGGEIHLLDSPFYPNEQKRAAARAATLRYYTEKGVPEMAGYYHHHLWADVQPAGGANLNAGPWARLLQKLRWSAPFPWVRVR